MNLLQIDYTKPVESFADKVSFGGEMLLLGIGTVFAVLIIIMISMYLFKLFLHDIPAKRKIEKATEPSPVIQNETENYQADSNEIIAVIAAAIAMAENEVQGAKFKVVSFKRI